MPLVCWLNFRLKGYVSRQYLWTVGCGNGCTTHFAAGSFHTKKLCSRLYSNKIEFYLNKKTKKIVFEPPFGGLRGNVITPSIVGKPVVDSLFVIIEIFRYFLRLRRYKRKSVEVGVFRRGGWVTLSANFRPKKASLTNHCWCQKTTVIALSCGSIRSVLFDFVTKHAFDRQTDRITTPKTALA